MQKNGMLFGFIGLILLCSAFVSYLLRSKTIFTFFFFLVSSLSLGAFLALSFQDISRILSSRQAKYSTNVTVSILALFGIAVVVNLLVVEKFDKAIDLTTDKWYTLSDQTLSILQKLDHEVKISAFFSSNPQSEIEKRQYDQVKDLLAMYHRQSDKISIEFVDSYVQVKKVEEYGIRVHGTTIFESNGKKERVTVIDEQKFTSAILKVTRTEEKKIYFLIGHGEKSTDDFDPMKGYHQVGDALENQGYLVENLSLSTQKRVPKDCTTLVIAAPKSAFISHEVNAIRKYLNYGGKLLLMLDPKAEAETNLNQPLIDLILKWGLQINNDYVLVLDPRFFYVLGGPSAPVIMDFDFHPIMRFQKLPIIFQDARSLTLHPTHAIKNVKISELAKISDQIGTEGSWGETKQKNWQSAKYNAEEDTSPPLLIAAAIEEENGARIVIIGDSDFASNLFLSSTGGGDFFLNSVNWLTLEEDLISISPIDPRSHSLRQMTANEVIFTQIMSIFLIPIFIFLVGVIVWWRRR